MPKIPEIQKQLDQERRKVDVDAYDLTVREIVRMVSEGDLKTAPAYQRKFRWSTFDESRLIESLFLGLPVPSIYVATNDDGSWDLVDGLQRVGSLVHFLSDSPHVLRVLDKTEPLVLHSLETLTRLSDKKFSELPPALQLAFQKRSLKVTALSDKSVFSVRFELFERLNRGGIALSPQEVRACIYRGPFADFLRDMAADPVLNSLLKLQKRKQRDGTREELVLKFFAYTRNRDKFKGKVKEFLNSYMETAGKRFDRAASEDLFKRSCAKLNEFLQNQKFVRPTDKVTPLVPLETCLVAIGELISEKKEIAKPAGNWLEDEELAKYSTKGTNAPASLRERIRRAKQLFSKDSVQGTLQNKEG